MALTSHPAVPTTSEQKFRAEARSDAAELAARVGGTQAPRVSALMTALIQLLTKLGLLREDLEYHLVRAAMVILFAFFGYQKWWD